MSPGGRPPPPTARLPRYFFFFLAAFFFFAIRMSPPFALGLTATSRYFRLPFLVAFFLPPFLTAFLRFGMWDLTSPPGSGSVTHRFAPEMGGLLPAPALVVVQIGVELRQADHREPTLGHGRVEDALVVGRQQVDVALPFPGA